VAKNKKRGNKLPDPLSAGILAILFEFFLPVCYIVKGKRSWL
jgi:hypothetical protein